VGPMVLPGTVPPQLRRLGLGNRSGHRLERPLLELGWRLELFFGLEQSLEQLVPALGSCMGRRLVRRLESLEPMEFLGRLGWQCMGVDIRPHKVHVRPSSQPHEPAPCSCRSRSSRHPLGHGLLQRCPPNIQRIQNPLESESQIHQGSCNRLIRRYPGCHRSDQEIWHALCPGQGGQTCSKGAKDGGACLRFHQ